MSLQVSVMIVWAYGLLQKFSGKGLLSTASIVIAPALISRATDYIKDAVDYVTDKIPWPPFDFFAMFRNAVEWFLNLLVTGFLDAIGLFFHTGIEYFLFYENPRNIDVLNEYWADSLILYVFIVFCMMFAYYVMLMLLADTEDAQIQRIVERLILSAIFLAISREVFGFFVALTNEIAYGILPPEYSFYMAIEMLEVMTTSAGVTMAAVLIAIFGGIGILISGVIFYLALAMRMLIIYIVYATMPVLLALWVVDVGPGKYGKFFADFMIKIAAVMIVIGVIIAGMLAVGAGMGGATGDDLQGVSLASDFDTSDDGTIVLSTDPDGPDATLSETGEGGEFASSDMGEIIIRIFMFLGMIWLIIAVMTSMFGMVMSAGSASPGGTGGYHGRSGGASTRGVGGGGGGSGSGAGPVGGAAGGAWGAQYNGATAGSAHAYQLDDGRIAVANPGGGGMVLDSDPGPLDPAIDGFGPEDNPLAQPDAPPNPFNPPEPDGVSLTEKAGHMGSKLDDATGGYMGSAASYLGGAAGRLNQAIPTPAKKLGNMGKRAGKAYWDVFKQPDVASSLGESLRIARESPIGKPDTPEASPDGPVVAEGTDPFVLGREHEKFGQTAGGSNSGSGIPNVDPEEVAPHPDKKMYGDAAELHAEGHHVDIPDEYQGRGPDLPRDENGNPIYGPAPEVEGVESANHKLIHNESVNIADGMDISDYRDVSADDVIEQLEVSSDRLDNFGLEHNTEFDRQQIEFMLEHQAQMGVPADVAIQRTTESVLNASGDAVGGLYTDEEVLSEFGVEQVPEELATDAAARRINLGREGTGGMHGDHMWRLERNDGSIVYAQDVAFSKRAGANAVQTQEIMDKLGVDAPMHHYDPVNRVLRAEGIDGVQLREVVNGNTDIDPSKIDRDEFLDVYASMGLTGHNDCHGENVLVTDDGDVAPIDFDFAGSSPSSVKPNALEEGARKGKQLGMDVTEEDVAERMEEMAQDYVDEVDSTAELVGDRMPDADADVSEDLVDEHTQEGMNEAADRQLKTERKKAIEQGQKVHQGIEDVAEGDTDWQRAMRGENQVDSDKQASQGDINAALDDVEYGGYVEGDSDEMRSNRTDTTAGSDGSKGTSTSNDVPDEGDTFDLENANSTGDSDDIPEDGDTFDLEDPTDASGSDTKAQEAENDYEVTESDVFNMADDVLDDMSKDL